MIKNRACGRVRNNENRDPMPFQGLLHTADVIPICFSRPNQAVSSSYSQLESAVFPVYILWRKIRIKPEIRSLISLLVYFERENTPSFVCMAVRSVHGSRAAYAESCFCMARIAAAQTASG